MVRNDSSLLQTEGLQASLRDPLQDPALEQEGGGYGAGQGGGGGASEGLKNTPLLFPSTSFEKLHIKELIRLHPPPEPTAADSGRQQSRHIWRKRLFNAERYGGSESPSADLPARMKTSDSGAETHTLVTGVCACCPIESPLAAASRISAPCCQPTEG